MNFFTIFHQKYGLTVSAKTPKSAFGNSPFSCERWKKMCA